MNPGRFYMPRMGTNMGPMMGASYLPVKGNIGLFSRIFSSLRAFNWSGLLNGANKTLNVVNQTIPLVRQAGPMLNNMRSMLRIAKAFGSETNRGNSSNQASHTLTNNNSSSSTSKKNSSSNEIVTLEKEVSNNNYPNFFV